MNEVNIDIDQRVIGVIDSLIGHKATITSNETSFPKGNKIIAGNNAKIEI